MKQYWTTVLAISVLALSPISWLSVMDGVEAFGWKKHTERTDWKTHKMEHVHYESLKTHKPLHPWTIEVSSEQREEMTETLRGLLARAEER